MDIDEHLFKVLTGRATEEDAPIYQVGRYPPSDQRRATLAKILSLAAEVDGAEARSTPPSADELLLTRAAGFDLTASNGSLTGRSRKLERIVWAAAIVLAVGVGKWLWWADVGQSEFGIYEIVTGANETVTTVLREGTVIRLAPRSRLRVNDSERVREVTLNGKAFFAVARKESEPFRVRTPHGDVQVLGTRFELDSATPDLKVTVVEGEVLLQVENVREKVEAGQIGWVMMGMPLPAQTVDDAAAMIDWLGDFLAFQSTPLRDAVREIERLYGVTVVIEDEVLAERTVTSHFADWELPDLIDALCLITHAICTIERDVIRMSRR